MGTQILAHYHLPGFLNFTIFTLNFFLFTANTQNIFTIGVKLLRFMARQKIVFGAEEEQALELLIQKTFLL